ncbi:hypothetical protein [Ktedonospora formicarum]|uniref:Erythromycin esterase n=1 Tax=Ktedonospora formicarum TaxID=2778364 RepID=A0A8J3MUS4_9CHLR|nr:hypothetical protein [Ktedonospora formicarum]GHO45710.1 hypothetical protein KSX_38730 [Ktedonospora formicarum]
MTYAAGVFATLDDWIAAEAIPCSLDARPDFKAAVDKVISTLDDEVVLLGFGEALHGGEELLALRNQLFQRLVEAHGYSAIAIESSFPRGPSSTTMCLVAVRFPMKRCRRLDLATGLEHLKRIENLSSG